MKRRSWSCFCLVCFVLLGRIQGAPLRPDLVVEDVWVFNGQFYCQVANIGAVEAVLDFLGTLFCSP